MIESTEKTAINGFSDFGFNDDILRGVREAGFTAPSPIQVAAIPYILQGVDLIAQAHTGTGKTAAFGLPLMNKLKHNAGVEVLVLSPTRELAAQVSDELFRLGRFAGVKTVAVYGGQSGYRQIDLIKQGANVVVATPGRLLDHLNNKRIPKFNPSMVVLDEADEMLDMGFIDDIKEIFSYLPETRQTLVFSATMPPAIKRLATEILNKPALVDITSKQMTNIDIEQIYCVVEDKERTDAVIRLIDVEAPDKAIVFCRTKRETDDLCNMLVSRGCKARPLHGDMDQPHRQDVIKAFRGGGLNILVATDVAARGLDVTGLTHVFNYHMPFDKESYVHRIGRTGRVGTKGRAITLVTPFEFRKLKQLQQAIRATFTPITVPTKEELNHQQDAKLIESIFSQDVKDEAIEVLETLNGQMDLTNIACKLISMLQGQRVVRGPERIGLTKKEITELGQASQRSGQRSGRYGKGSRPAGRSGPGRGQDRPAAGSRGGRPSRPASGGYGNRSGSSTGAGPRRGSKPSGGGRGPRGQGSRSTGA